MTNLQILDYLKDELIELEFSTKSNYDTLVRACKRIKTLIEAIESDIEAKRYMERIKHPF